MDLTLPETGWTVRLVALGVITTLGASIPVGFNIGVINAPSEFIKQWSNITLFRNYDTQLTEAALSAVMAVTISIALIGGVFGSLGGAYLADKYGRPCFKYRDELPWKSEKLISLTLDIVASCAISFKSIVMELKLPDAGLTRGLFLFGVIVNVSVSMASGFQVSSINAPAKFIQAWIRAVFVDRYEVHLSPNSLQILWSSLVSTVLVGGMVASHFSCYVSTTYGRKKSFLFCALLLTAGALCFVTCRAVSSVELLLLGRLLVGLSSGLTTGVIPMYLAEVSPIKLRGAMGVLCPLGLTTGVVVGQVASLEQVLGTEEYWHYALSCYAPLNLICYVFYFWIPESPKYLYSVKGDQAGSLRAIRKLFGRHTVGDDYVKLQMECAHPQNGGSTNGTASEDGQVPASRSFCSVVRDPTLTLPLVLVCALQGGQQLSGINAVFFYSVSIFESVGLSSTAAKFANLGVGCLNLVASLPAPMLMARFDRRALCQLSCSCCAVILFVLTLSIYFKEQVSWFSHLCIATILLYIIFYQFGLGPIPFFIGSELFDLGPRPTAMALGSLSSWGCNFIVGMAFPTLQGVWGAFVFLPFSITCGFLTVLLRYYLPETRGKEITDVVQKVSQGFRSRVRN